MTIKFSALCLRRLLETRTCKKRCMARKHNDTFTNVVARMRPACLRWIFWPCLYVPMETKLYGECLLSAALICVLDNSAVYKVLA